MVVNPALWVLASMAELSSAMDALISGMPVTQARLMGLSPGWS